MSVNEMNRPRNAETRLELMTISAELASTITRIEAIREAIIKEKGSDLRVALHDLDVALQNFTTIQDKISDIFPDKPLVM